jgi:outer membrane protein TolC
MRHQTSSAIRLLSVCLYAMSLFTLTGPALAQMEKQSGKLSPKESLAQGQFLGFKEAVELALQNHPAVQEGNANLKASEA